MPNPGTLSRQNVLQLLLDMEWSECVRVTCDAKTAHNVVGMFHFKGYKLSRLPEHVDKRFHVFAHKEHVWIARVE